MLLKYKTVLLTGGASGIGRASALMLAEEGARVLLCDRNAVGAAETIAMARGGVEFIALELTDTASIDACAKDQGGTVLVPAGVFVIGTKPPEVFWKICIQP